MEVKNLIYKLETAHASQEARDLLDEAALALTRMCAEVEFLRSEWTRLKMLYELDSDPRVGWVRSDVSWNHIREDTMERVAELAGALGRQSAALIDQGWKTYDLS
jgi:hypothetical protein